MAPRDGTSPPEAEVKFPTAMYLRRATSRAKSDVANKLVSMLLHDVSRRVAASFGLAVNDPKYAEAVEREFGDACCYCGRPLECDRASVEHLEGMNRFRMGLHIPGNVAVACKRCNAEKRRDDQLRVPSLADSGWESFLWHDATRCPSGCATCRYWSDVWPEQSRRVMSLERARGKIFNFRAKYEISLNLGGDAKASLGGVLDELYRDCQQFALERIGAAVERVFTDRTRTVS